MTPRKIASLLLTAALAGCGGRSTLPSSIVAADAPTNRAAVPDGAGRTTAYAFVYADPSGQPLAGEPVKLYPWTPCTKTSATTRSCPDALYGTTTNGNGEFVLANVPNGHYLLAIGDDDPADLAHPTIHDQIWLKGGHQHLVAPTLPVEPKDAPYTIPVPAIEKSGNYRMLTLNKSRQLCSQAFDTLRAEAKLPPFINDEWLAENMRSINAYMASFFAKPRQKAYGLSILAIGNYVIGGNDCTALSSTAPQFNGKVLRDPRTLWLGAIWYLADPKKSYSGYGYASYETDPRLPGGTAPHALPWP